MLAGTALTREQRAVVNHGTGPLLVASGPGAGKTGCLVARVVRLLETTPPQKICVVTFSNRAADDFKERLRSHLGDTAERLHTGTIHAIASKTLRRLGYLVPGYSGEFTIWEPRRCAAAIRSVLKSLELSQEANPPLQILEKISLCKERLVRPHHLEPLSVAEQEFQAIYQAYQGALKEARAVDFGDLILHAVFLLERNGKAQRRIAYRHVLLDEGQDTSLAQMTLVGLLLDEEKNLTAVGSLDQAVYGWRGADPTTLLHFEERFPGAQILSLGQNFRSTQTIVNASLAVIQNNRERRELNTFTHNEDGMPIQMYQTETPQSEAKRTADRVYGYSQDGIPYEEIAILYRTNQQSLALEEALIDAEVPYQVAGLRFFDRPEIGDVLLWLRVIYNPEDWEALEALVDRPNSGMTRVTWDRLLDEAKRQEKSVWWVCADAPDFMGKEGVRRVAYFYQKVKRLRDVARVAPLPNLLEETLNITGLTAWYRRDETEGAARAGNSPLDNLEQLRSLISRRFRGFNLKPFLEYVERMKRWSANQEGGVHLMTLHAAKGLEFDAVFIVGAEEGVLPHARALEEGEAALEEERRLFYVGATRPRKQLSISYCMTREGRACQPSRFLSEIPADFLERL
jgi:DNA helicase-2/ATP-dependent DNA helicase PcrA